MYEINSHEKQLSRILENLKKDVDNKTLEGLIIIKVPKKTKEVEIEAVFGCISQFEWVGILDYVSDIVKGREDDEV